VNYPTITIEGTILSAEILERLEGDDVYGQKPSDYGLKPGGRVKDEIARAWGESLLQWKIFQSKKERVHEDATGTTETRQFWIVPFLDTLGYRLTKTARAEVVSNETYDISHVDEEVDGFPAMVMGWRDSLDTKRETGGPRLSPHALVQEYLNVTEHLYGIVTNGHKLRLLRDSSRLTRLSYLEFDLEGMMDREAYSDFAILYRLLHRTRMPRRQEDAGTSIIEHYHQEAIESGARIRDGLSHAVEEALKILGNGLLHEPMNNGLRERFAAGDISARDYFTWLLRIVYRLLFLFVVEERDLIYSRDEDGEEDPVRARYRDIYNRFYAVSRLRRLAEERYLVEGGKHDLWIGLFHTFRLFESEAVGSWLGIAALDGELFGPDALGVLKGTRLRNEQLLHALWLLTLFHNSSGDWRRINYAALNVEEFGSVYEGLLDLEPTVTLSAASSPIGWGFGFLEGSERANTGSHYTPDELVRPLVQHALNPALDPVIEAKTADARKRKDHSAIERALLSLTVCDVACGSGHFLLAAARRIGFVLAQTRTGEEQPNPRALRVATRDVISHCIYGVDKNPMAVELCRVALWLEAHNPGKPLTFLDHRIRCGDAIVGVARAEDLERGIPDEAFAATMGDDKAVALALRKRNKAEREGADQLRLDIREQENETCRHTAAASRRLDAMPDDTLVERQAKQQMYAGLHGDKWMRLKRLADLATAQFFLPKTTENARNLCTEADYRGFRETPSRMTGSTIVAAAQSIAAERKFFHWFLEFPEVFDAGGFDCILGNPPFLGNRKLRSTLGGAFLDYATTVYAPAGAIDLVGYFFRRIFDNLRSGRALGCIATNTLAQGNTREGSLAVILDQGGTINYAIRSMKWPGRVGVEVTLMTLYKGEWIGTTILDGREADQINSYLSDDELLGDPYPLEANKDKSFQGSIVLGMGFVLEREQAQELIDRNPKNRDVIFPYLNGEDLNSRPDQSASRWVINFFDWSEERAQNYTDCYSIIEKLVKPERQRKKEDGTYKLRKPLPQRWWQYADKRPLLYRTIAPLERVLVVARVTKPVAFCFVPNGQVFHEKIVVFSYDASRYLSVLQSDFHHYWARQYSSTLGGMLTVNYSPSSCFETFPIPDAVEKCSESLDDIGSRYHTLRSSIMHRLQRGLTKIYNLFHTPALTLEQVMKDAKCDETVAAGALRELEQLRALHAEMDEAVKIAYGWNDLKLEHGFHEVDFLPENDRVRYTISPAARKEVLRRLLKLNHERYAEEQREKENARSSQSRRVTKETATVRKEVVEKEEIVSRSSDKRIPSESIALEPSQSALQLISGGQNKGKANLAFRRGILGCELAYRQPGDWTLGERKMMKQLRLIELESQKKISEHIYRAAAGPYDNKMMYSIKSQLAQRGVKLVKSSGGQHFGFTARAPKHDEYFDRYWGDIGATVDRIIKLTRPLKTHDISLVGTLYEAWNDLLAKGYTPTDNEIIHEATIEWHPKKLETPPEEWHKWLQWMKKKDLIPGGIMIEEEDDEPVVVSKPNRSTGKHVRTGKENIASSQTRSTPGIGDIDNDDVVPIIRAVMKDHRELDRESLIKAVASSLGYQRTGKKIRERVESAINASVRRGVIASDGGVYVLETRSIEEYDRETLTKALLAVLGSAWHDQHEAIQEAARYLGFRRTGSVIQETFESVIMNGVRNGNMEREGGMMRRRKSS